MDEGVSANAIKEITPTHIQKLVQAVRACGYESKNVIAISVEKTSTINRLHRTTRWSSGSRRLGGGEGNRRSGIRNRRAGSQR